MIGCDCRVCTSSDPHNKRFRVSILVRAAAPGEQPANILVDTTPEMRLQILREGIKRVDYGIKSIESKIQRGGRATGLWFVLDPRTPWPAAVSERATAAARARFERDATTLKTYRDEPTVRAELELDAAEALFAGLTHAR